MNTKSNSETDMKTKQPGINFVPDCQTGFPDHVLVQVYCAGMTKRRVMKRRVILESYDFGELCVNHAQTTPTFTNDHTQFLNFLDVFLN